MSESPAPTGEKSLFTEKEERVLKVAWSCLKSGPPDIDLDKLMTLGDFKTKKTASNTWGSIKKKLATIVPAAAEGDDESPFKTPAKKTPAKKGGGKKTPLKPEPKVEDEEKMAGGDTEPNTPEPAAPTKRKSTASPTKNAKKVKTEESEGEEDMDVKPAEGETVVETTE